MKKVLVLIEDGNQISRTIEWALFNAGNEIKTIVLAHVVLPNADFAVDGISLKPDSSEWEAIKKREQQAILFWKNTLKNKGYDVSTIEIDGIRIKNLVNTIKAGDFDLIVMSSKGRSWLEDKIMGSPWSELINNSHVPIFIIPSFKKFRQIQKI